MKVMRILTVLVLALLSGLTPGLAAGQQAAGESVFGSTFQAVDMNDLATAMPAGAATLKRTSDTLQARLMVEVAEAGAPYTVWWVIFNNPEACAGAGVLDADGNLVTLCDGDDTMREGVDATVYNASGGIAAANGIASGVLNIDIRTSSRPLAEGLTVLAGDGLEPRNGFEAEVHVVVQRHPRPDGSWVADLTGPIAMGNHRGAIFLPAR